MTKKIHQEDSPSEETIHTFIDRLNEEASKTAGLPPTQSVAFTLRDENNEITGGIFAVDIYGVLVIDAFWVHPDLRGKGYGEQLLLKAEAWGRERGCTQSSLFTMDWCQAALTLYAKHGYEVIHRNEGHRHGAVGFQLRKQRI